MSQSAAEAANVKTSNVKQRERPSFSSSMPASCLHCTLVLTTPHHTTIPQHHTTQGPRAPRRRPGQAPPAAPTQHPNV